MRTLSDSVSHGPLSAGLTFETNLRVILHTLRLSQIHCHTVILGLLAPNTFATICVLAAFHEIIVKRLFVSQRLWHHLPEFLWGANARIKVVRKPIIVC